MHELRSLLSPDSQKCHPFCFRKKTATVPRRLCLALGGGSNGSGDGLAAAHTWCRAFGRLDSGGASMNRPSDGLRRALGELVIIVLGVLIALGVDSIWEQMRERSAEAAYLEALFVDALSDSLEYETVVGVLERAESATESMLAILGGGEVPGDPLLLSQQVFCASFLPLPVINRTTLDDLLSTGNLNLLRDRELRSALLEYYGRIATEMQWSGEHRANQDRYRQRLSASRWSEISGDGLAAIESAEVRAVISRLRTDTDAVAALNGMLFAQRRVRGEAVRLSQDVADLLSALRIALEDAGIDTRDQSAVAASGDMPIDLNCLRVGP